MIEKVVLKDRDTGQTLETFMFNRASSASGDTYDFEMDVSSYFVTATTKEVPTHSLRRCRKHGKPQHQRERCGRDHQQCADTELHQQHLACRRRSRQEHTDVQVCQQRFGQGHQGYYRDIHERRVEDPRRADHTLTPTRIASPWIQKSCLTEALTHGAYPLRIHGEDVGSGVRGNYLHTAIMVVEAGNNTQSSPCGGTPTS